MSDYSISFAIKIWDDKSGEHIEITEDGDGLGLVEIRSIDPDGTISDIISMERKQAEQVLKALSVYLSNSA